MPRPILYAYQKRWLDDTARFKIGMFSRQSGKTYTTTLEIAEDIIRAELEKRRVRWVILSRGERQAREAMDEGLKVHLRAFGAAFEAFETDFRLSDATSCKSLEVTMKHGSRVTALPANADTARGFSANVFLDEFAFHADSRKIWAALFPVISRPGLRLRVVSTPNGKNNKFFDLMTGKDAVWSRHTVDIYQAVADGLPRDIEELREGCGDADAWAQEYELQWQDEASAWLPYDLITACEHEGAGLPDGYSGGPVYVGVDIGRRHDLFVIWVLEAVGDVLWTRELIARKGATFAEQGALLDDVFARYRVLRVAMDQTGMGEMPVEETQRRHGTSRVEGVLFTAANKLALATLGKQAFEDRRLRIPLGETALRADLHKLQKVSGPTGTPRFVADSDAGGHADRTWALFLAVSAASTPAAILPDYGTPRRLGMAGMGAGARFRDPDAGYMPTSRWSF
ncbi:MAG: terminase family protein [Desulfovibrio sp.]|nr:terminase family protein [Desulfovibrio sp.]